MPQQTNRKAPREWNHIINRASENCLFVVSSSSWNFENSLSVLLLSVCNWSQLLPSAKCVASTFILFEANISWVKTADLFIISVGCKETIRKDFTSSIAED